MWSAMKAQKRAKPYSDVAPDGRVIATKCKPFEVILGWGGSGKSYKGFNRARRHSQVGFLGLTAALLDSVPDDMENVVFKMTIAAFLARPALALDANTCLYIDEISMVPPQQLDSVLKRARHCTVLCTGDVYQIPPILPDNAQKRWFFESDEYARRNPKVEVITEQHRLTGPECKEIRDVLEAVAYQHRASEPKNNWKDKMNTFVEKRRLPAPPQGSTVVVFTNKQIDAITKKWAAANDMALDRHGLCKGLPVTITANKIKAASSSHVEYEYRNGERGSLVSINEASVTVKLDATGKNVTVQNTGVGKVVPQVKSALAITVDAAQGKTIPEHVHVIIPKAYTPHPARLLVAFSRSKSTSVQINDKIAYARGLQEAEFCIQAVQYAANFTL